MAKDSFDSYIQKNQSKYANIQKQLKEQQDENAQLSSILDEMAVSAEKFETGSYSKLEVAEAAKSLLKAQPYNVDITHMDLTDNAVYYNTETNKSRGRFSRKNIRDYGNMMIEKAKVIRQERKEAAEEEARLQKLREEKAARKDKVYSTADEMNLQAENISIGEQWQREEGYEQKEADYYSSNMFDKFKNIPGYAEKKKNTFQGEMASATQERIKTTLSGDIPPFDNIVAKLNENMKKSMKSFAEKDDYSEEDIAKHKESLMKSYSKNLKVIESRYRDVKEGKISPEAFKLFMDPALFTMLDSNHYAFYQTFVSTDPKLTDKEAAQKKKDVVQLNKEFNKAEDKEIWKKEFLKTDPYKASVDKIAQMYHNTWAQNTKIPIPWRQAFLENDFIHFTGKNYSNKTCNKRYYITCKADKHKEMLDAWATVLKKNEKLSQTIKFKFGGTAMKNRKDNIVIYAPEDVKEEDMKKLMEDMSKECTGKEILAEGKEELETAAKLHDGISTAPEFPVNDVLNTIIKNGLYNQKDGSEFISKMKAIAKTENKIVKGEGNTPTAAFSYNSYLTKASFLAESIVRQKHGIGPDDSIDGNEEMMKEARTYFNDFIRLSGVDPATFNPLS